MLIILNAESAAAFDSLTRGTDDDLMKDSSWPSSFRQARFIPAVEYIQANRIRTLLMEEMDKVMQQVDVFITPSFGGNVLADSSKKITVVPRDAMRRRIYIAPFGLWLTLDSGTFSAVEIDVKTRTVTAYFDEGPQGSKTRLRIEQPARIKGVGTFAPVSSLPIERGAFVVAIDRSENGVRLAPRR